MSLNLKVCGMRDAANIMAVAAQRPQYMGFIYYEKSPRYVGADFHLPDDFPAAIQRVGVFVNAAVSTMVETAQRHGLHYLQLHGHESVEVVKAVQAAGIKVIKVFSVDETFDFATTTPYEPYVDYFLFDTKGRYYGGNAATFDWQVLERYSQRIPFFLSGGLTPENVADTQTLQHMNLYALDVNSGVEAAPGVKDIRKIEQLQQVLQTLM